MDIPPWHVGHVVKKLMLAHEPEMKRGKLAALAGLGEMTITNMIKFGRSENTSLEKVARVFEVTALAIREDAERANQGQLGELNASTERKRRASDRDPTEVEAEMYMRRMQKLPRDAQNVILLAIRAFESAFGSTAEP
jgi:hypothetical protein